MRLWELESLVNPTQLWEPESVMEPMTPEERMEISKRMMAKSNPAEKAGLEAVAAAGFLRCRGHFCGGAGIRPFLVLRPHYVDLGICGH